MIYYFLNEIATRSSFFRIFFYFMNSRSDASGFSGRIDKKQAYLLRKNGQTRDRIISSILTNLIIHIYRSIKKVISLRNISKVFSHFYTLMVNVLPCMYFNYHEILLL